MKRNQNKKPAAWNRLALLAGLIAIGAVIAFGLAGCDNSTAPDNGSGDGGITVTGFTGTGGKPKVGDTLTANYIRGGFNWQYNSSGAGPAEGDIAGADSFELKVPEAVAGKYIRVVSLSAFKESDWLGPVGE